MRLVFGFVLLIGIGLAGSAVYLAKDFIGQQQAQLAEAEAAKKAIVPTVDVFVVNKQMRYGQRLTVDDLKLVRWPEEAIPEGAFTSEEELFPKGTDVLRSVLRTMEPNEAVLATKVTGPGLDAGISSRLSPGMRAFAIRTDVTTGVSGFLRVGDRVDVYWTGQIREGQDLTKLIQTGIRIIGINQSADEDRNGPVVAQTVTVEIDPEQVASLATAQANGRLSLSLVGADDVSESGPISVTLGDAIGVKEETVVEVAPERKCYITEHTPEGKVKVEIACSN